MKRRSVILRNCNFSQGSQIRRAKIKTKQRVTTSGFASPVVVAVVFAVLAFLAYIYSINQSAVKGFEIKAIEKEIAKIEEENEALKIKEAELKSLYKIEQFSQDLNMVEATEVVFLDETESLALNSTSGN